jgi:cell wall-associated NlpC family hydrolase
MPINGIALSSVAIGSVLIWSGIKGWNLTTTIGQIISGKAPSGTDVNVLTAPNSASANANGFTSSGTANDALQYQGHAYSYGGAPGKNGTNPWDCSSFANWVIGHDMKRAIPGYGPGQYDGSVHGPPTGSWIGWMTHISESQAQAGDLVVSATHMGIVIGPNQMVSALNSRLGTKITPIAGYFSGPVFYGRPK